MIARCHLEIILIISSNPRPMLGFQCQRCLFYPSQHDFYETYFAFFFCNLQACTQAIAETVSRLGGEQSFRYSSFLRGYLDFVVLAISWSQRNIYAATTLIPFDFVTKVDLVSDVGGFLQAKLKTMLQVWMF